MLHLSRHYLRLDENHFILFCIAYLFFVCIFICQLNSTIYIVPHIHLGISWEILYMSQNYKGQTIFITPRKPMNVRNKTAWQSARILLDSCYTTCSEITIHQLGGQHLYGVVMLDHHDLHSHKRNGLQMNFHSYQVVTFDSHTYIPP